MKPSGAFPRTLRVLGLLPWIARSISGDAGPALGTDPGPAARIVLREEGRDRWIEGTARRVRLDLDALNLEVRMPGVTWRWAETGAGDLAVRDADRDLALNPASAGSRSSEPYRTGYSAGWKVTLAGWRAGDRPLDLELQWFVTLDGPDEDLLVELLSSDRGASVQDLRWPGVLAADSFDAVVVPFMQGMLLPVRWPTRVRLYDTHCFGRGLYQPWWGYQQGGHALLALLETPDDAGCRFEHPAGGPTRLGPRWTSSLGRWSYPRRLRYAFVDGDYNGLAKRYRRHAVATGRFVSLREKIARNPAVGTLIGAPVIHTSILYHIQPESSYFNRTNPAANHQWVSFDARATEVARLRAKGVTGAYLHLDGWGTRGYDNLHPDVLPPNAEAGGWDGMRRFAAACAEAGFVFAIHDQYRDYYLDAPSYQERHTLIEPGGKRPLHSTWYGGRQSILCQRLAPGYVRRNHADILAHGVKLRGAYLDVFSVVPPDECHAPEHPVTRSESLRHRGECLDSVRAWGGIVSSEEPSDWSVRHLDLVHHGPYPLDPGPGAGPAMGIPVPLFNLVYHDALLVPWSMGRGGWGIPEHDSGFLHGLGNAGLPYLSLEPDEAELGRVRTLQALHRRVGLLELVAHRFLDDARRRQEFRYADGTTVVIDLAADNWSVHPALEAGTPGP